MIAAGISGLGLYLPDEVRTNDAWPPSFVERFHGARAALAERDFTHIEQDGEGRPYDDLYRKHALPHDGDPFKGAVTRRVAPAELSSAECDARAVRAALAEAGVAPRDVSVILSSALVPDRLAPSNGPAIAHLVGCVNAAGIGVEGFCSSSVAQLDLAAALVQAGRANHVVCVQSHLLSRINDLDTPMSPIFGDASAAFVVSRVPDDRGLVELVRGGDGSLAGAVTYTCKARPDAVWYRNLEGPLIPGTDDLAAAKRLARHALAYPIDTIRELAEKANVSLDAVACFAAIQPLAWYQAALADGLGVPANRVPSTYTEVGHLGSAGIVANLLEGRRRGHLRDGAMVVVYAHGAGVTRYGAMLRWAGPA